MTHDNRPERRPAADVSRLTPDQEPCAAPQVTRGRRHAVPHVRQAGCPLVQAAVRLDDPAVLTLIALIHPPWRCPAARERAA